MITSIAARVKKNWKSGLTVALVSIPLSVSLAVASESTPTVGIITAVWAGVVASLLGGSNYNIVGPTGALSGVLASYAILHGSASLAMVAIVAGVFTLVAGLLKLERYLVFVPASTIHGFTLGVAFIIAFNQFNFAFGLSGLVKHERFILNVIESFRHIGAISWGTFLVFVAFLVALLLFARFTPKLPGAITLTPIGILLGYLSFKGSLPFALQTLGAKFPDISSTLFIAPHFYFTPSLVTAGITVALVAILETMISARIADGMTGTKHQKRKEIFGLGAANIVSGLMGGIPATAALARTSLNIKTGAQDKISATISSVAVAVISIFFLKYFQFIPLAVIAAILVFVAIRMVEHEHFIKMFRMDRWDFFLSFFVAFITVYEDPIVGILFGASVSLVIFMEKLSKGQFELIVNDAGKQKVGTIIDSEQVAALPKTSDVLVYSIKGQLAYINAQSHIARFERDLVGYRAIIIRLRELYFVDLDGVEAFNEIVSLVREQGKEVCVTGVSPLILNILRESKCFKEIEASERVFGRTSEALVALGYVHLRPQNYNFTKVEHI